MAKDPAFLFYYQDFAYGTRKMTLAQKGAYIELMCEQADVGHLSLSDIKAILKEDFPIWDSICCKYSVDNDGKFYNFRLEEHLKKRRNYVESRKNNLQSTRNKELKGNLHMDSHMGKHMENRDRNYKVFKKPNIEDITIYSKEIKSKVNPEEFFNFYESKGWMVGKNKMKDWKAAVRGWSSRNNLIEKGKYDGHERL